MTEQAPVASSSAGSLRLPDPGALVTLVYDCCHGAPHYVDVVEVEDGQLYVVAPDRHVGVVRPVGIGTVVEVSWPSRRGVRHFMAETIQLLPEEWWLYPTEPVQESQRRRFVRVPELLPLELRIDRRRLAATLVDISEGGMRCVFEDRPVLTRGHVVAVELGLPDVELVVQAEVVRVDRLSSPCSVSFRFVDLTPLEADALRHYVFAKDMKARKLR